MVAVACQKSAPWVMRLWMLPRALGPLGSHSNWSHHNKGLWPAALMLASPLFVLSIGGLMPDMPLLACILIGWGGYRVSNNPLFSLVMGTAALFRYNAPAFALFCEWMIINHNIALIKRMVFVLGQH